MKTWGLLYGKTGYRVSLYENKWWLSPAEGLVFKLCTLSRHSLCCGLKPEVFWRIPVGKPVYDEMDGERWMTNSINSKIVDFTNSLLQFIWRHGENRLPVEFSVSKEQAKTLNPDFVFSVEESLE